jgi:NAD(P)-dependent dehydrogenase (short-subunit alcohol dehydrogenase family)
MNRFPDWACLVTGASSGIGRATAVRLASEGARVVLVARDPCRLDETLAALPTAAHVTVPCDLTSEEEVVQLAQRIKAEVGPLRGVVHCAGIHWLRPLQITDNKSLLEMLTSHVVTSISLTKAIVSRRLAAEEGCSIIWLSSAAALQGAAGGAAYSAAKGAMTAAVRPLAVELARRKVRINAIAPGVVKTPQSEAFLSKMTPQQLQSIADDHLLGFGTPEDIAGAVAFLLSDDARWITGTTLVADGGLTAH